MGDDLGLGRGQGRAVQGGAGTRDPGLKEKHWKFKPNSLLSEGPAPDRDPGPGQSLAIVPGLGPGPGRTRLNPDIGSYIMC